MAKQSDEEKAKKVFDDVDDAKSDETVEEDTSQTEEDTKPEAEEIAETKVEADKAEETEEETKTEASDTLTKPFSWLKGDSPDDWTKELATAYENSTNEALRLKKQNDDNVALIEEAKKIIANSGSTETTEAASGDTNDNQSILNIDTHPAVQYAKSQMEKDMISAFDEFAKKYPQARQADGFQQIEKASPGAAQAFVSTYGRTATYPELFEKTAALLGWEPDQSAKDAKKGNAIKEGAASSQTVSSSKPAKKVNITEKQMEVARRLFPNQKDEEIVKDLANYVT